MDQAWEGGLGGRRRASEWSGLRKSADKREGGSLRLDAHGGWEGVGGGGSR